MPDIIAVILSCNQLDLTYNLMRDIEDQKNGIHVVLVDNGGGYERQFDETIIKPAENLRWTRGNNLGLSVAEFIYERDCDPNNFVGFAMLNDDIKLSNKFFDGLRYTASKVQGLIAPIYDDVYEHQKRRFQGDAKDYIPCSAIAKHKTVDGTAWLMTKDAYFAVGRLNADAFPNYGWGADIEYCIRTRLAGYDVVSTEMAYINHFHQGSAKHVEENWSGKAGMEMEAGMTSLFGENWRGLL
jgi:GT2 family glycosyltransferase